MDTYTYRVHVVLWLEVRSWVQSNVLWNVWRGKYLWLGVIRQADCEHRMKSTEYSRCH